MPSGQARYGRWSGVATVRAGRKGGGCPGINGNNERGQDQAQPGACVHGFCDMTLDQGIVLAGIAYLVFELLRGRYAPAALFSGVALVFILLDYVSLEQGLRQFTNTGLVTVAVLLLLSGRPETAAAFNTGLGVLVLASGAAVSGVAYALMVRLGRLPEEARVLR